jgi:hypothetical protein
MATELLPSELLQIVRLSLKATQFSTAEEETFNPRNPAFRKLVEAILFSRRFVVTYYGALAVILLSVGVIRWTRKTLRNHSSRSQAEIHTPQSFESTNTTLGGNDASLDAEDAERRPLINKTLRTEHGQGKPLPSLLRWLLAGLLYQPQPIPALTAPKNALPDNGTTLAILLLLGLNLFYLVFRIEISIPMLFAFADRAGLCFVMNLPVLYALAAKTNQPVQLLTGWTYEGLNIFHRRLGEWMTILATLHSVGMLGVWYTLLRPLHFTLLRFVSSKLGLLGVLAFVSYLVIYISSIGRVRRLVYERFLLLHITFQVLALVFLFFHHHNSRPYVLVSFGIWAVDRLVVRMGVSTRTFVATLEVASDQQTVLLFCDVPINRSFKIGTANITDGWQTSQHVFVTVPGMGYVKHRLQAHPFTIASPAPPKGHYGPWELQLTIRAQDGFSRELLEYAKFHQHTRVLIDGPYGSTDTIEAMRKADRVYLVAGGSGIAVTYPLAWELYVEPWADSAISRRTIYEAGQRRHASISHYETLSSNHTHVWIRQDVRSDQWLTSFPRYHAVKGQYRALPAHNSDSKPDGHTVADLVDKKFETGGVHALRPCMQTELEEWVASLKHGLSPARREKLVVIVSGPDGLVRDIRNSAASLVRRGWNIEVHVEKFGW